MKVLIVESNPDLGRVWKRHLERQGADVTLIDQAGPATHASRGTFAWINATWAKQPRHYHRISQQGVANWHTLARELDIPVRWGPLPGSWPRHRQRPRLPARNPALYRWAYRARPRD